MKLGEIDELLTLLEGEHPTTLFDAIRLRRDALTCLSWLQGEAGDQAPVWIEKRARAIFDKSNEAIARYTAKPRLCLNG